MAIKAYPWVAGSPVGANGEQMQEFPDPKPAYKAWGTGATSASSILNLSDSTTVLDIAVLSASGAGGLAIKWVGANDTTASSSVIASGANANFDHVIPSQWRMRVAVPKEVNGISNSVVGIRLQQGLYGKVAIIGTHAPVPSVFIAEH